MGKSRLRVAPAIFARPPAGQEDESAKKKKETETADRKKKRTPFLSSVQGTRDEESKRTNERQER